MQIHKDAGIGPDTNTNDNNNTFPYSMKIFRF